MTSARILATGGIVSAGIGCFYPRLAAAVMLATNLVAWWRDR